MSRCLRAERPLRRPAPRTGAATYTYSGGSAQFKNSDAGQVECGIQIVRYHYSLKVRQCAQELGIQLEYLPPYSPDRMPVERVWHWLRQQLTALHCHSDESELRDRIGLFEARLNELPGSVFRRLRPKLYLNPAEEKLRI